MAPQASAVCLQLDTPPCNAASLKRPMVHVNTPAGENGLGEINPNLGLVHLGVP
jgi:hypothetical protein